VKPNLVAKVNMDRTAQGPRARRSGVTVLITNNDKNKAYSFLLMITKSMIITALLIYYYYLADFSRLSVIRTYIADRLLSVSGSLAISRRP
jgi:hypothetical protein